VLNMNVLIIESRTFFVNYRSTAQTHYGRIYTDGTIWEVNRVHAVVHGRSMLEIGHSDIRIRFAYRKMEKGQSRGDDLRAAINHRFR